MRSCFPGYLPKSEKDFDLLWENGIFVFDTNILLNMYRYSRETQNVFFTILDRIKERVWLPHQVVKEFFKNRIKVITDQDKLYKTIIDEMKFDAIKNQLNQYKDRHVAIKISNILEIIEKTEKDIKRELNKSKNEDIDYLKNDVVLEKLLIFFDGRVGKPYNDESLNGLYKEAQNRYKHKIPPGYKDEAKEEPEKYNDFIIWSQIIEYAKGNHTNIILVTDDNKEDWWQPKYEGKTIGPRLELLDEVYKKAGMHCHIYNTRTFLDVAKTKFVAILEGTLVDTAIGEVESVNKNSIAESSIKDLNALGYSLEDMRKIINELLRSGSGSFSTMDVVEKLTGKYHVGDPINRTIGVILSELQEDIFSIVPDGRISCLDNRGRNTTSACWKRPDNKE
ncbi:PIN domain-containing protein [Anaeroselena agilis]|uniref:PIN domain-containing protein n=1 Tax=Anaeroselena agilis TaxID=3063788 RepID=A0ABU3NV64_9FIRM|nr:PIN domain-containing protein [Selenomonadales bacterium 4137-cl]